MIHRVLAVSLLASVSIRAAAADPCTEFLENYPTGEEGWKTCLNYLASLEPGSAPSAAGQGQESMATGLSLALTAQDPSNISVTDCAGTGFEGDQNEVFIAVDPNDPMHQFAISKDEPDPGLLAAFSIDGGECWSPFVVAGGSPEPPDPPDPLGEADPWAVYDDFGNLYISYLNLEPLRPAIVRRWNQQTGIFDVVQNLPFEPPTVSNVDRPMMAIGPAGPNSPQGGEQALWIIYHSVVADGVDAHGAAIDSEGLIGCSGPGSPPFCAAVPIAGDGVQGFPVHFPGDVAIGPDGQVLVAYYVAASQDGPSEIRLSLDPDGLGPS